MTQLSHENMKPEELRHYIERDQSTGILTSPCLCMDPAEVFMREELCQALNDAMRRLTSREKQVVSRVAVDDSPQKIAKELSLSVKWVKKLRARGLNKLRREATRPGRRLANYCACLPQ